MLSNSSIPDHIPKELSYACTVLRLLYDVALDAYDKPNFTANVSFKSPTHRRHQSEVILQTCSPVRNLS